jgi:hypothetical protein
MMPAPMLDFGSRGISNKQEDTAMRLQFCVLLIGGLLLSSPLVAQDEAPVESAAEAPAPAPASAAESAAETAGAAAARAETDDDDFVPSEEIPPDEQVVFPVDI